MAESSSPAEVDYLDSCENTVRSLEDVVASGRHLLNPRQCKDLSSKLSKATRNVRELVLYCETFITPFRPGLEDLHRCLEKAEALVRSCAEEDWCGAAILQIRNESAFGDILEDVGSCYKAIYEDSKSAIQDWNGAPEDLQQTSVFESAMDGDVRDDKLELEKRLNESAQVEVLNLCRKIVLSLRNVGKSAKVLLNGRQCVDLSSKLCITALNVFQLVSCGGASVVRLQLGLKSLYQVLERAKALVSSCADDDWLAAAVFQMDNENAFRMILLDVSLCYNALYELARSTSTDWHNPPEDLRHPSLSVFMPAPSSDVEEDRLDLQKRLDDLANGYTKFKAMDYLVPGKISRTQSLAKYLLEKMCSTPSDPQVAALDMYSAILWRKVSEPMFTWGSPRFLGSGSGASGVVSTTWLGIPCAKKEFHGQHNEGFFLKEAGILAHLKHPCVVNFVCCGNGLEKGDRFIAMELMEKSLVDLIEEQVRKGAHFPLHVVVDMMVQIARGVCYLHGRGVAHRDLKPQNVVVSKISSLDGESHHCVKLVDFGMSKTKVEASKVNTMSAFGIGTTRYRAPEVGRQAHPHGSGRAAWFKADAYSFAMTCAHLLSLKTPFEEMEGLSELHTKLMNGGRPSLPSDCPMEIVELLEDCWNTRAKSRPTFGEICRRLEKFKYALLMGDVGGSESDGNNVVGYDFLKRKVEEQSLDQGMLVDTIDDGKKEEFGEGELQIRTCPFGHALQFLPQPPSWTNGGSCDICWKVVGDINDKHYQCRACDFDIHPHCSKLELEVNVFLHRHPLHLLIRNYYNGNPKAICCICEEQVQHSEWVYRCETCDVDVHALCTKLPEQKKRARWHEHPLIIIQCPPYKTLSCACCNGEVRANSWMYTCLKKCTFYAHPSCTLDTQWPVCVFDNAHTLSLIKREEGFYCNSCGGFGFSWFYHCEHCDVNIHLDCKHNMVEEDKWNEVYEEVKAQYIAKDNHIEVVKVVQLVDQLLVSDNLGGSSWLSPTPTPELKELMRRVEPNIRRLAAFETPDLSAIDFDDSNLRMSIAAETIKRKAKRMATRIGRLESKTKHLKMLEIVERMVVDLQSHESVLQGNRAVVDARLEKLKIQKRSVEGDIATLVQSRMRHGPRTILCYEIDVEFLMIRLLTTLQANMEDVRVLFLCEEPRHEHYVDNCQNWIFRGVLGEERMQKLKALLGPRLEVVVRAKSALERQPDGLDRVMPIHLRSWVTWDLSAIDVEEHGKLPKEEENADTLKGAEDSAAEWVLSEYELRGESIFKLLGLLCIRYKESEKGNCPGYTRGSVAWLCKEHVHQGLEAGILESHPVKFYDPKLN